MNTEHINLSFYISSTLDRGLNSLNPLVSKVLEHCLNSNKSHQNLPTLNSLFESHLPEFKIERTYPNLQIPFSSTVSSEIWTDASLILSSSPPKSKCAILDNNENSFVFIPCGTASTTNVELQAIAKALELYFHSPHLTIYSDSLSSVLGILNYPYYKDSHLKKLPHQNFLLTIIWLIHQRNKFDYKTEIHHVYSHLLDHSNPSPETLRKLEIMKQKFGNDYLRILKGNQKVDLLTNDPQNMLPLTHQTSGLRNFTLFSTSTNSAITGNTLHIMKESLKKSMFHSWIEHLPNSQRINNLTQSHIEYKVSLSDPFYFFLF